MIAFKKIVLKKTTKRRIGIVCAALFCLWIGFVVYIGLGYAAAARGFWAHHGENAHAGLFRHSI